LEEATAGRVGVEAVTGRASELATTPAARPPAAFPDKAPRGNSSSGHGSFTLLSMMPPWQGILSEGELASLLTPARGEEAEGKGAGVRGTASWRGNGLGKRCYLRAMDG
jgi:hypothetical protein